MSGALIRQSILELARARGEAKSICPSEVARRLAPDDWRPLMQAVRDEAVQLAEEGQIVGLQGGEIVNLRTARGAIRIRISNLLDL